MRILLVSDYYPPFIGGAHRQTQLLGQEMRQRGHAVSVATVWYGGAAEEEDDAGVRVYRVKQLRTALPWLVQDRRQRHATPFPDPVTVMALRRVIERVQPDVIHAYGWLTYSLAAALMGKDIPLLISSRDYAYSCANRTMVAWDRPCSGPELAKCLRCTAHHFGPLKGWVSTASIYGGRAVLLPKVYGIHSISTYVQYIVERDFLRLDASKAQPNYQRIVREVIPSFREDDAETGIGPGDTAGLEPYLQQLPKEPFILFVGALRVVKGIRQLLAAYERLEAPPPLVLIGTVEKDTPANFPPGVVVVQSFPHPAVMAAWKRCLFGVFPSLLPEPLGSVVYEGMSQGKAVIGTTPGGHADMIISGETGFLVAAGEVDPLVSAMQTLINSPDLRERFGRAGRDRADLFTAAKAVPSFERLYRQLMDRANHKGQTP
jgi:glycosyltransferase involved in cell wall biosynthesis